MNLKALSGPSPKKITDSWDQIPASMGIKEFDQWATIDTCQEVIQDMCRAWDLEDSDALSIIEFLDENNISLEDGWNFLEQWLSTDQKNEFADDFNNLYN